MCSGADSIHGFCMARREQQRGLAKARARHAWCVHRAACDRAFSLALPELWGSGPTLLCDSCPHYEEAEPE